MRRAAVAVLLGALAGALSQGAGADTAYSRLQLAHGISLEIPAHWKVLSQASRQNTDAAAEAVVRGSGIGQRDGRNETILAVKAVPDPTGAMIRLNVMTGVPVGQAQITSMTEQDLSNLQAQTYSMFKKMEPNGGPRVTRMGTFHLERINGKFMALVMPYERVDAIGPWQVLQYKIPTGDRLIELTMSYRENKDESLAWKTILQYVRQSMRF